MKMITIIGLLLALLLSDVNAQTGGSPGAYSRMGFGSRGISMGNAHTALIDGELIGYYNPAAIPFSKLRTASLSFGILDLDRSLNFIGFTQPLRGTAGVSAGFINAGISDIDGRDSDGEPTGPLRTSENQIFMSFGTQVRPNIAIGVSLKFLHNHLYTDVTSTTVGIDFGALYVLNEALAVGATVKDINSKYSWDTAPIYGQNGGTREDEFPVRYSLGAAWRLPDSIGIAVIDIELTNLNTLHARIGIEIPIIPELTVRAGVDRVDLKESGAGIKPAVGFSLKKGFGDWVPALNYAYVIEPFAPTGIHLISLSATF